MKIITIICIKFVHVTIVQTFAICYRMVFMISYFKLESYINYEYLNLQNF